MLKLPPCLSFQASREQHNASKWADDPMPQAGPAYTSPRSPPSKYSVDEKVGRVSIWSSKRYRYGMPTFWAFARLQTNQIERRAPHSLSPSLSLACRNTNRTPDRQLRSSCCSSTKQQFSNTSNHLITSWGHLESISQALTFVCCS